MSDEQSAANTEQTNAGKPVEKPETVIVDESEKTVESGHTDKEVSSEPTRDNDKEGQKLQNTPSVQITQDETPQNDTQEESTQQTSEPQDVAKPTEGLTKEESTQKVSEPQDVAKPNEGLTKEESTQKVSEPKDVAKPTAGETKDKVTTAKPAETDAKEKKKSSLCTVL